MEAAAAKPFVVVGVDGSPKAERALGWAIEEAKLRSARVRVVTAWQVPLAGYAGHGSAPPAASSLADAARRVAEKIASGAAAKVREEADLAVETRVVEGEAAEALIDAAGPEDELVVGGRSKSGHPVILTSSVTVQCVLHAPCPTTVIP